MMENEGFKTMEMVALRNGVPVEEVRKEIELAIDAAMTSPDRDARAFWDEYIQSGRRPTPEEVILYAQEWLAGYMAGRALKE